MITDSNGQLHIALNNYNHTFCYYISVLQRLHCSPTLSKLINADYDRLDTNSRDFMLSLKIYSELKQDNAQDIYLRMKSYFDEFIPAYISNPNIGYSPVILFGNIFLPIIYHYWQKDFSKILRELHCDCKNISKIEYVINSSINAYLKKFAETIYEWNTQMVIPKCYPEKFVCAILELKSSDYSESGHAVTLINSDKLYVIDDDEQIIEFGLYCDQRKGNIQSIIIRDINEEMMNNINIYFNKNNRKYSVTPRISSYELVFGREIPITYGNSNYVLTVALTILCITLIIINILVFIKYNDIKQSTETGRSDQ